MALEMAETDGRAPLAEEASRVEQRRAALAGLDPERWPLTSERPDLQAAWIGAEQLSWGLDRLLDGLALLSAVDGAS